MTLRAAVAAGDDEALRAALIAAWRTRRSPVLAELVDLLETRSPDATSRQLAAIVTPRVTSSLERLRACAKLDDPRLARFALDALVRLPFTSPTAEPFLRALIDTVARLRDPRLVERAPEITAGLRVRITRAPIRDDLLRRLEAAIAKLPAVAKPTAAERKLEVELAGKLEPLRKGTRSAETLLADIYAHPSDDGPRLVYADLLSERGDPRGELIVMQIERGTGEPSPREIELLKLHGKAWLGSLAPVLSFGKGYSGTRFARGFVANADIILSVGKKLELVLDDPAWATIETFSDSPGMELLSRAPLRGLRRIDFGLGPDEVRALAERREPLAAVHTIAVDTNGGPLDAATLHRAFPGLVTLRLYNERTSVREVAALAALGIEHLLLDSYWKSDASTLPDEQRAFDTLLAELLREPAALARLSLVPPWRQRPKPDPITLRRSATGHYERSLAGAS